MKTYRINAYLSITTEKAIKLTKNPHETPGGRSGSWFPKKLCTIAVEKKGHPSHDLNRPYVEVICSGMAASIAESFDTSTPAVFDPYN